MRILAVKLLRDYEKWRSYAKNVSEDRAERIKKWHGTQLIASEALAYLNHK
jgi:hypothetical protein